MTNIHYEPDRQGMTCLPDIKDEATGAVIEGTAEVVDTRYTNFVEQSPEAYEDVDDGLYGEPPTIEEDIPEATALDLADISEEVMEAPTEVNLEMANAIAQVDLGDSAEAVTVQYLASKFYQGDITGEEAIREAVESGLDTDKLAFVFHKLKNYFQQ